MAVGALSGRRATAFGIGTGLAAASYPSTDRAAWSWSSPTGLDVEFDYTTVTDRETEGKSYATVDSGVRETMVFGEGRFGQAVFGSDASQPTLDMILAVNSNRSFPPREKRDGLTQGHRRQLRDAMILQAHVRENRDALVTEDAKGFISDGRRERLELVCRTKIFRVEEFCEAVATLAGPLQP